MKFVGFDVETRSLVPQQPEYALQPQRAPYHSRITYAALARPDGQAVGIELSPESNTASAMLRELLRRVQSTEHVVTWNGVFDIGWLIAYGLRDEVQRVKWLDAKLLWKWVDPNRHSYHLIEAAKEILLKKLNLPWVPRYIALKQQEKESGFQTENTGTYNQLDSYATAILASYFWPLLTAQQQRSVRIEAAALVPVAGSWVEGVPLDLEYARSLEPQLKATMARIEGELGLSGEVLASPTQLRKVIYEEWRLPVLWETNKGEPSTDKTALTYLTDHDRRAALILDWREANTRLTKFVNGALRASEYNGRAVSYSFPSIYATYTGRMTYNSRLLGKAPVGIAMHQIPRGKVYRQIIVPPAGNKLAENDFAGQEMRLMADIGEESVMRALFREGKDPHSYTGAGILRIGYDAFMERYRAGDEEIAGPKGGRYLGKFTNLSLQYRTSAKTLRRKARVDYGVDADLPTAKRWHSTYHDLYPGVRGYWKRAIRLARVRGYAETMAGRRYYLSERDFSVNEWETESTAINHPIQGTGADQKELGLWVIAQKFPELRFAFDLHDGIYFWVAADQVNLTELLLDAKHALSNLPYFPAWGWVPAVPYPVDTKVGERWGLMEEIKSTTPD